MTAGPLRRAFVDIAGRRVHYRTAGSGPPVVLLHQTPASSAEMVPLMRHLAPWFTVYAPDTPGFGASDPIAAPDTRPHIDAYADALLAFLDALGLQQPGLVGSHTGAIFATRFACRHPQRVSALVPNGILLNTAAEREELVANYVQPFVPDWAGMHLAWLWSRLRDQLVFYPAYKRQPAHRIEWPMTLDEIEAAATELLDAGDDYRSAYFAALPYDIAPDLVQLRVPTLLAVAQSDALVAYVPLYPPRSAWIDVAVPPDGAALHAAIADFLRCHVHPQSAAARSSEPQAGRPHAAFVDTPDGSWHLRRCGAAAGRPLLMLHDLGASVRALDGLLAGLACRRPWLAPDLPGHGLGEVHAAPTPATQAAALQTLLDTVGAGDADVLAVGASAAIALALQPLRAGRRITLCNPRALPADALPGLAQHLPPDLQADPAGSHLLRAWGWLKDRELYSPWSVRSAATALRSLAPPQPAELQQSLIDLLRARPVFAALYAAALRAAPWEALAASGATVLAVDGHPAQAALPGSVTVPADPARWAALLD